MAYKVALELVLVAHTLFLHLLLAVYAHFPVFLDCFVASDVDVFIRKKLNNFCQYSLKELESTLVTHAEIP